MKICDAYGVSADWLLGREASHENESNQPPRVAAGGLLASGTGFGAYAAACMDGGAGVDVIGVLVLSGLGLVLAGGVVLYAARKIRGGQTRQGAGGRD